jgi:hypothetical protein
VTFEYYQFQNLRNIISIVACHWDGLKRKSSTSWEVACSVILSSISGIWGPWSLFVSAMVVRLFTTWRVFMCTVIRSFVRWTAWGGGIIILHVSLDNLLRTSDIWKSNWMRPIERYTVRHAHNTSLRQIITEHSHLSVDGLFFFICLPACASCFAFAVPQ